MKERIQQIRTERKKGVKDKRNKKQRRHDGRK
jgi:hypothetical protein